MSGIFLKSSASESTPRLESPDAVICRWKYRSSPSTMARLGRCVLNGGGLSDARQILVEALTLARQHHERISETNSLMGLAVLAHLTGDAPEAIRLHQEAIAMMQ